MAKEYKAGDRYYLPVCVNEIDSGYLYSVRIVFNNGDGTNEGHNAIKNEPDLLLTATEIAENGLGRRCGECLPMYDEVVAERDNLKADLTTQKEVNEELKAWYEEANKTATEAAEANDELKTKIADLRDEVATLKAERCSLNGQVGKNLAEIQALSSDVHFFKEACKKQKAECDELKGRYDELDSVNKEQAEKIRDLDKTVAKLKDENTNLSFLLEDQPEKEVTKPLNVVLNDGTEIEFRRYTAYDYRTDIKMFVVKDGERFIAGFNRGDKSFNFAYWWTE